MALSRKEARLKVIEDKTFEMGNTCEKSFKDSGGLPALRSAIAAYRCSMQAMRDQVKFSATAKKK